MRFQRVTNARLSMRWSRKAVWNLTIYAGMPLHRLPMSDEYCGIKTNPFAVLICFLIGKSGLLHVRTEFVCCWMGLWATTWSRTVLHTLTSWHAPGAGSNWLAKSRPLLDDAIRRTGTLSGDT